MTRFWSHFWVMLLVTEVPVWPVYTFVTVTDSEHFPYLKELLAQIDTNAKREPWQVYVYDLGMTESERAECGRQAGVEVRDIEDRNPFMRQFFRVRPSGRRARGWYSWKPVVIHQALQHSDHFLYIDACMHLKSDPWLLFEIIRAKGYLFFTSHHAVGERITHHQASAFRAIIEQSPDILKMPGLSAGIQGISSRIEDSYVRPIYALTSDIRCFEDDGSALNGFGEARHDQTLFSLQALALGMRIMSTTQLNEVSWGNRRHYLDFSKVLDWKTIEAPVGLLQTETSSHD